MTEILHIEQGTPEWLAARAGSVGASSIQTVMAKGRAGAPSKTRETLMGQLVAERLTGEPAETFTSAAMEHGNETEPQARAQYTMRTGVMVEQIGLVKHPTLVGAHASPDGLIGVDGCAEIKCPNTATHIKTLRGGAIERGYMLQMQWQMECMDREWCDFISFDPRMPDDLQIHIQRVPRDAELCAEITEAVTQFLAELNALERYLREMQAAA